MYKFTITEETLLSIHLAKRNVISGQVVVKGMTYRLDHYEPALLPGKDGWESRWESGGS